MYIRYKCSVERTNKSTGESAIDLIIVEVLRDDLSIYSVPLNRKFDCGEIDFALKGFVR